MTGMTLLESAKLPQNNEKKQAIIEMYAGSSSILETIPFENINGNAISYNEVGSLPGIGFRGVNEAYTPSVGVLNPLTERLVIAGGELDVDAFIVNTEGADRRSVHEAQKARALALSWTDKFINGDSSTSPREFDGLSGRAVNNQLISAGTTSGGAALSLKKMDEAIDQCLDPNYIIMNKAMKRKFIAAARSTSVSGYVTHNIDSMGREVTRYNGLPILTVDLNNEENEILGFDEAASTGDSTATSIYVVSFGPMGVTGIQNGGMDVRDLGELEDSPVYRTRIEWYCGLAVYNGRSVVRLQHIGDLDIVA